MLFVIVVVFLLIMFVVFVEDKLVEVVKFDDFVIVVVCIFVFVVVLGECDECMVDNVEMVKDVVYLLIWKERYGDLLVECKVMLFEIYCMFGVYNMLNIYVLKDVENKFLLVFFVLFIFDVVYVDGDEMEIKLKYDLVVIGYLISFFLMNLFFDEKILMFFEYVKWCGIGDVWFVGDW